MDRCYPIAIVFRELLHDTNSMLRRLQMLAECRDVHGVYRHERLEQVLADEVNGACGIAHNLIWSDWARFSLEQQRIDLIEYLRGFPKPSETLLAFNSETPMFQ
ncbi:MAG: hypothetical protein JO061_16500 [Acidobacteriaceae bacterium]|nr:hypothetical protein [Acidobacteriaceae bacterium]MBV9764583.1 hypothetical protein [Acidobacteriaceae bacterium]